MVLVVSPLALGSVLAIACKKATALVALATKRRSLRHGFATSLKPMTFTSSLF